MGLCCCPLSPSPPHSLVSKTSFGGWHPFLSTATPCICCRITHISGLPHEHLSKEAWFCGSLQQGSASKRRGVEASRSFGAKTRSEVAARPCCDSCTLCSWLWGLESISGWVLHILSVVVHIEMQHALIIRSYRDFWEDLRLKNLQEC